MSLPGSGGESYSEADETGLLEAWGVAEPARAWAPPNPWVGCVVAGNDGVDYKGATGPAGGDHAEVAALRAAGGAAVGSTLYVTLEPCAHRGRTGPCAEAVAAAGVSRVVVGTLDPDARVSGAGIRCLAAAGLEVCTAPEGSRAKALVESQLESYRKHRLTGRPWVVLKLAASLDGRIAAPDGSSRWITGEEAREDVQRLRQRCQAVMIGAGTVRADDPHLTVRAPSAGRAFHGNPVDQPLRVVLGRVPPGAAVAPALELGGDMGSVLDQLGARGVLEVLVEGGATVAHELHRQRLVDRYVIYLAPVLFGGDDAVPMFKGTGAVSLVDAWRGRIVSVERLGGDLRMDVEP